MFFVFVEKAPVGEPGQRVAQAELADRLLGVDAGSDQAHGFVVQPEQREPRPQPGQSQQRRHQVLIADARLLARVQPVQFGASGFDQDAVDLLDGGFVETGQFAFGRRSVMSTTVPSKNRTLPSLFFTARAFSEIQMMWPSRR